MSKLTEEQLVKYLANDGEICPFCSSKDIDTDDGFRVYEGRVEEEKLCVKCKEDWTDIYMRTTVK